MDQLSTFFYTYLYGDWESLARWLWICFHVSILLSTALVGYTFARGEYLVTGLLVPLPLVYFYKRYQKAKTYTVQSETPV